MDFLKIAKAWIASYNPTEKQTELAEKRYSICDSCPSKVKALLGYYKCNECGCPIQKKIFSDLYNDCPLKKWESVDTAYFPPMKKHNTLT
jgi:hypothetical protein